MFCLFSAGVASLAVRFVLGMCTLLRVMWKCPRTWSFPAVLVQEWTTATGNAEAAALAQLADGAFYAACPTAGEAGWGIVYKDDHEEEILQADGETVKKMMVNEASTLLCVVTTGKAPPEGFWLGRNKYRITRTDDNEECGDHTLKWIQANYPKHGVHIIVKNSQIVVGFFDEDKQSSGNCKKVTCDFAAYFTGEGY